MNHNKRERTGAMAPKLLRKNSARKLPPIELATRPAPIKNVSPEDFFQHTPQRSNSPWGKPVRRHSGLDPLSPTIPPGHASTRKGALAPAPTDYVTPTTAEGSVRRNSHEFERYPTYAESKTFTASSNNSSANERPPARHGSRYGRKSGKAKHKLNKETEGDDQKVLKSKFILHKLFLHLDFYDLTICKQVCKTWNDVVSAPAEQFWYEWSKCHFDFVPAHIQGCLAEWHNECRFLKKRAGKTMKVFHDVPTRWNCGIIVPNNFVPFGFDKNTQDTNYCHLAIAINELTTILTSVNTLDAKCVADGNDRDSEIEVVLLPWTDKKFPSSKEVLRVLNIHEDIIKSATKAETINPTADEPDELEESILVEDVKGRDEFYCWLAEIFHTSTTFQAGEDIISPRMHFLLTRLSKGYVGGIISAII